MDETLKNVLRIKMEFKVKFIRTGSIEGVKRSSRSKGSTNSVRRIHETIERSVKIVSYITITCYR